MLSPGGVGGDWLGVGKQSIGHFSGLDKFNNLQVFGLIGKKCVVYRWVSLEPPPPRNIEGGSTPRLLGGALGSGGWHQYGWISQLLPHG